MGGKQFKKGGGKMQQQMTVDEFFAMEPDWPLWELIDGIAEQMASPAIKHQTVFGEMHANFEPNL